MTISLIPVSGFPAIRPGDRLAPLIAEAGLEHGDIVVIAQKIVSKSENRIVKLSHVNPGYEAQELARYTEKDPRLVQLILDETERVIRAQPGLLIVEHLLGYVMANAGIDASNVSQSNSVILLPKNPDASSRILAQELQALSGQPIGVIISDSWGRPWRIGTSGFAIGLHGLPAVRDMRGTPDLEGRPLESTFIGIGDELAAAASLLMGQANEGVPVVVIRGFKHTDGKNSAADLIRPRKEDLFR